MDVNEEQCDAINNKYSNIFLTYVGLIFLCYVSCKLLFSLCRGLYCYIAPVLCDTVNWKEMGKWAVITGGTDGIGKAYAKELASRGLDIVLISRTPEKLKDVAGEIEKTYKVHTKIIPVDFTGGMDIYDEIKELLNGLEIGVLVNNIGMSYGYAEYFTKLPDGEQIFENIIKANIISCTKMMFLVLPQMEKRRKGVVINVSSMSALYPTPLLSVYSASKVYMDYLSKGLYYEYKKKGIIIQSVLPSFVSTKMSKMRPSIDVPSADSYVHWTIRTVGLEYHTYGYPSHKLRGYILEMMYHYLPEHINLCFIFNILNDIRKRYYKKHGLVDNETFTKSTISN